MTVTEMLLDRNVSAGKEAPVEPATSRGYEKSDRGFD